MPVYVWMPLLLLAVGWIIYKMAKGESTQKPATGADEQKSLQGPSGKAKKRQTCPVPIGRRAGGKNKALDYFECSDRIVDGRARAVLTTLAAHIPALDRSEAEDIAKLVDECFEAIADEMPPHKMIAFYDDSRAKNAAFAAVTENGPTFEMASIFARSLDESLPEKSAKKIALDIARSGHPLVASLASVDPQAMSRFLDEIAQQVIEDWADREDDSLPDMPEETLCEKLCALLAGEISAQELQAEFEAEYRAAADISRAKGLIRVKSSERGSYEVDPVEISCTCEDWKKRRSGMAKDSPERLCKHLVTVFMENKDLLPENLARYAPLFPAINRGMPSPGRNLQVFYGEHDGKPYIMTFEKDQAWAKLYVDGKRYLYKPSEKRWESNRAPEGEGYWAKTLTAFTNGKPFK